MFFLAVLIYGHLSRHPRRQRVSLELQINPFLELATHLCVSCSWAIQTIISYNAQVWLLSHLEQTAPRLILNHSGTTSSSRSEAEPYSQPGEVILYFSKWETWSQIWTVLPLHPSNNGWILAKRLLVRDNTTDQWYVVVNMSSSSTVESSTFRQLVSMIPCSGGTWQMGLKTLYNYLDREYPKMS